MKHRFKFLLALTTLLSLSSHAQNNNNPWALSFGFNVVDTKATAGGNSSFFNNAISQPLNLKEYWNVHPSAVYLRISRLVVNNLSVEFQGSFNTIIKVVTYIPNASVQKAKEYIVINPGDLKYYGFDGSVKYSLMNLLKLKLIDPSLHFGGGYSIWGVNGFVTANAGAGLTFWFNKNIGFTFDTTLKKGFGDNARSHLLHTAGISYQLQGNDKDKDGVNDRNDFCPNIKGLKQFNGCPDTDGDGIFDSIDVCPDVIGLVEMNGCPDADLDGIPDADDVCPNSKGLSAFKGCPDTDNDGIVDNDDQCPTLAGLKVNSGCPFVDADGDEVADIDDTCPTVKGPKNNKGCPEVSEEVLNRINTEAKSIYFNSGKTTFKSVYVSTRLDAIATLINNLPASNFTIESHTDNDGVALSNQILSEERANVIREALIIRGVSASRLTAVGYGASKPIATNTTAAGKALNRRIEVVLDK